MSGNDEEVNKKTKLLNRILWEAINGIRFFAPGTYNPTDMSVTLQKSLEPVMKIFVIIHEGIHHKLSTFHFGEMLRRVESFNLKVFEGLDLLRIEQIVQVAKSKGLDLSEVMIALASNDILRTEINQLLSKDELFMQGLEILNEIERKKSFLLESWQLTQEGGAYWLGCNTFEEVTIPLIERSLSQYDVENAKKLLEGVRKNLSERNDINGQGYRLIHNVANTWGKEWVFPVLEVCMCPDICKILLFDHSDSQIAHLLKSSTVSPDRRLEKIQEIISKKQYSPPQIPSQSPYEKYWFGLHPLMRLLDPDNECPALTVEGFNLFWNTQDAHPKFVDLMNRILARLGIEQPYQPIVTSYGNGDANQHAYGFFVARNEEGEIEYIYQYDRDNVGAEIIQKSYVLHDTRMARSTRKEAFLTGMKNAGLI